MALPPSSRTRPLLQPHPHARAQYTTVKPDIDRLLAKLVYINETVLELSGSMASASTMLNDAVASLDTFFTGPTSPATIEAKLAGLGSSMAPPQVLCVDGCMGVGGSHMHLHAWSVQAKWVGSSTTPTPAEPAPRHGTRAWQAARDLITDLNTASGNLAGAPFAPADVTATNNKIQDAR